METITMDIPTMDGSHATRHIIRRTMTGGWSNVHDVPSPRRRCWDEPSGAQWRTSCALFFLPMSERFNFEVNELHIEPADLVATVGFDEQDAYSASRWIAAPSDFLNILRIQSSQIMRLKDEDWLLILIGMNTCSTRMHDRRDCIIEVANDDRHPIDNFETRRS